LVKDPQADDAPKMGKLVLESAARMQALIDNLMDLARGRLTGGLPLNREAVPLEPVLREVIDELNASQPDRLVEAVISLDRPVDCDRLRIAQLFSNLLGNALTYGSPDRAVRVRAACDQDNFELSVVNAGEPIPPAALDHLFHPFYRSKAYQNREGLGLGLYIAHEIAIAHGGTLSVQSTAEETRFTFRMAV
jgi:sigma-B regulation protein RsbU (phosphoserine phosphatase)